MSVTLHTTVGDLKIEIFCESVPKASENFIALCASGKYNNTKIHRNVKGFMVQMGDTTTTTTTGKKGGESIWGGYFDNEIVSTLRHNQRGIVSMANAAGKPNTNGSQFFITYGKQVHLDGNYTVFGKVIEGNDTTLTKLEQVPVDKKNRPIEPIYIQSVTIHANPLAD